MTFGDMTGPDRAAYFNFHGSKLDAAWSEFVAAAEKFAGIAKACGAIPNSNGARYADTIMDAARNGLEQEVSDYLHP